MRQQSTSFSGQVFAQNSLSLRCTFLLPARTALKLPICKVVVDAPGRHRDAALSNQRRVDLKGKQPST